MPMTTDATTDVVLQCRGEVSATEREYAGTKIARLSASASEPILFAARRAHRARRSGS